MAETEVKHEKTSKRVVGVLSAIYWRQDTDPVTGKPIRGPVVATHGEEIDLVDSEVKRLEAAGALLPDGSKPEDAIKHHEARLDAYRAERGDQEALQRHYQRVEEGRPELVNVDANVEGSTVAELAGWIRENKPTVDDTVALAEDDPGKAGKVLEAESIASDGAPRSGVEQRLQKIIDG